MLALSRPQRTSAIGLIGEALADALRGLVMLTGEPDLSVGVASERGLLDWRSIAAA